MKTTFRTILACSLWAFLLLPATAVDLEKRCQWRTEVERVYHTARTGIKKEFGEEFTPAIIMNMVNAELFKESVLLRAYNLRVSDEMISEEIRRINDNTRSPETLAQIKAVLKNDDLAFAETVVRPVLVERLLRQRFNEDRAIHIAERQKAISAREKMGMNEPIDGAEEHTWLLKERPHESTAPIVVTAPNSTKSGARSYSNEATAQIAQVIKGEDKDKVEKNEYLSDLHPELVEVLRKSLLHDGDISPIIETPAGFGIYKMKQVTSEFWKIETVFIPRKNYDSWLESHADAD